MVITMIKMTTMVMICSAENYDDGYGVYDDDEDDNDDYDDDDDGDDYVENNYEDGYVDDDDGDDE